MRREPWYASHVSVASVPKAIVYPDSDGQPMADNTLQFRWIVTIKENLDRLRPDFVAGDLLWYPVEGQPKTRIAPDVLVACGRPKGDRGSYKQWEEDDVIPQVVWEIMSPGNRPKEMTNKHRFYERFGVEEYYVYDPDRERLEGYFRQDDALLPVANMLGFVSPRLGIRFELTDTLHLFKPDGTEFLSWQDIEDQRDEERNLRIATEAEHDEEKNRRVVAEARNEALTQENEALKAKLRAMGIDLND